MPSESERTKILEMIADGTISAEEGVKLLDVLEDASEVSIAPEETASPEITAAPSNFSDEIPDDFGSDESDPETEEVLEPDEIYHPDPVKPPDPEDIKKWKRWWVIPMWVGVGITVLGGAFMYGAFARSGVGYLCHIADWRPIRFLIKRCAQWTPPLLLEKN